MASPRGYSGQRKRRRSLERERAELVRSRQRSVVLQLLNSGIPTEQVVEVLAKGVTIDPHDDTGKRYPMQARQVRAFVSELRQQRADELMALTGFFKSEQVARLQADIVAMRTSRPIPWHAVMRAEELLMKILGTAEPERIEVTGSLAVREQIVSIVMGMGEAELDAMATEQALLEARAATRGNGGAS